MTSSPLHVCFLWHMHQPYYKDPTTGQYRLPWVRLHGTKDYLDMLLLLKDFPAVRQNFNLVPSLLEQLVDYADHGAGDRYLEVSAVPAADLVEKDRVFILENFFLAHWDNMVRPWPRYFELLTKRGTRIIKSELARTAMFFTEADFRDLQVLFNLTWIDPLFRDSDPELKTLEQKGRNFTEDDKRLVIGKQIEILRQIIPAYRSMAGSGQIELSCTPFYHPILPLLCDTDIARHAMPQVHLPKRRFAHPEDAERQIVMGLDYFEQVFGYRPSGMWPSEGSVSEQTVSLAARHGVRWMATDEGVLAGSLKQPLRDGSGVPADPRVLYRPYSFRDVSFVFRDHALSDRIGFVYSQWDPVRAADDLVDRLLDIRRALPGGHPYLVPVILDGENAWEHYRNDGRDFFLRLYERLSGEERLRTVTIGEYTETVDRGEPLEALHPGSWINANFGVWIGHEEDNTAWDYLSETREHLERYQQAHPEQDLSAAWKSVYIAEGSDWNWWYGEEHSTDTAEDFDELFRLNLMNVHRVTGSDIPDHLHVPVLREDRHVMPSLMIRGFIRPTIDGIMTSYYEWYDGARLDVKKSGGSMHRSEGLISSIHFGFNESTLFLRADPKDSFATLDGNVFLSIVTVAPAAMRITTPLRGTGLNAVIEEKTDGTWIATGEIADAAVGDIFEIAIPFSTLKAQEKDEITLFFSVRHNGAEIERCPWRGHLSVVVPSPDFEAMMWS